jgi:leucyl/phenylalanyl-tRNA---protein transferase
VIPWVSPGAALPPAHQALDEPNGLVCASTDLTAERLIEAYRGGLFPWYSAGQPVLWWSPDPRMVLPLAEFKLQRSLVKRLREVHRSGRWRVSLNENFEAVMRECALPRPDQDGTWITAKVIAAYAALHRAGHAHSVEVWDGPALAGGLYGVALGRMFYGESMFARQADASKCALAVLVELLRGQGFELIDCQQDTRHLGSLGGRTVARDWFLQQVRALSVLPAPPWSSLAVHWPRV